MTREALTYYLRDELKYPEFLIETTVDDVMSMESNLKTEFEKWFDTKIFNEIIVEEHALSSLLKDHNMSGIAAFLTLDWLLKEPKIAKEALKHGKK